MKKNIWFLLILGLTAIDQITKTLFRLYFPDYVLFNDGVAFSMDMPIILPIIISFVCLAYIYYEKIEGNIKPDWTLAVFAAGILGNLVDRLLFRAVVDFIHVGAWPVFNIADVYLTTTAIYFIYLFLKLPKNTKH